MTWHEGDVVRKLRQVLGWRLKDLKKLTGLNISVIHDLEVGTTKEAKRATLIKLAAAFGLTLRELQDQVPLQAVRFNVAVNVKKESAAIRKVERREPRRKKTG